MQNFHTPAPIAAFADIPAGSIRFVAGDRADTTVEVRPADAAKRRDVRAAEQTTVAYADGVLRIAAPAGNQILGSSGFIAVTVQLPAGSSVEATGASVELRGTGRLGEVTVEGAHGSIELAEAAAVRAETQAGDVTVGRLTGSARITTRKGDIRIAEAERGEVVLRTEAGDVSVGAAAGVSASLDAGTSFGRIHNALRNDGTAGLTIRATTDYGDINARSL
ncbi:DUF4097 family beta strand repeat-containing protein [Amycolatopsis thermoflava]|uniref:DUF4097 family beta strand repeat-containing protein n=1 Tax=Amycolatopsis thermoflava TaxID=84480 RepID=UPI0038226679